MEHQKILDLNYDLGNINTYNKEVLKSNLCDNKDAYILIRDNVTVTAAPETEVSFKHCASFTKCITKIDGTTVDDTRDF